MLDRFFALCVNSRGGLGFFASFNLLPWFRLMLELLYTHIYWLVVKVIVVTVILDQLMLQIATFNGE